MILAALLLPFGQVPLGELIPTLGAEAGQLTRQAAAAADRVAASLARQAEALRRVEEALSRLPASADAEGRRAAIARLAAAEPALRNVPVQDATDPPDSHALVAGRLLRAEPDAAALAAALPGPLPQPRVRLFLLGPEGQMLASATKGVEADEGPLLASQHAVDGWPLRVVAIRSAARPAGTGFLPLGAAILALVLLAALLHRRERRAVADAMAEERREAQRSATLAESAARLRLALGAAELGCWSWDEAADEVSWDSRAADILGWSPAGLVRAAALRECLEPDDRPLLDAALAGARRTGEPTQCALRLRAPAGAAPRWIELRAQASPGPHGTLWHGVVGEITARREAEEEEQRLLREVDHRAKNTLAVVQAVLRLTRAEDPATFVPRVEARIAALARAHTLLAQSRWHGAGLHRLAAAELDRQCAGTAAEPAILSGPPVMLSPVATQPMAMALHELASNAARHGALAQPGGRVALTWRRLPDGGLELVWQEHGAWLLPPGPMPGGFGNRILDATVREQLGGRIGREWSAAGLRCVIHLPPSCVLRPANGMAA